MSIQNKFMNRLFRRVAGVVIDATTGKTGIKTDEGVYTIDFTKDGKEHTVSVNIFDGLSFNVPGFASQVALDKVNLGDIIVGDKAILGFVVGKTEKALKLADHNGYTKTYTPPKVSVLGGALGGEGVLVVQSLFSLTGSAEGAAGLAGALPMLMLMGEGNDASLDKLLPLVLLSGANGQAAGGLQGILPLLLLKEGGLGGNGGSKLDKLLPLLAMGGLGGGAAGAMNPLMMMALMGDGDLFGSAKAAPVAPALNRVGGVPALRHTNNW